MSKQFSYSLNGADRFQLYFDAVARRSTGIGNVIRASLSLDGIIPEQVIRQSVEENEWIRFISGLTLRKKLLSPLFRLESGTLRNKSVITFHSGTFKEAMDKAALKDCDLFKGDSIHLDVAYESKKTLLIFSVSHVIMDHAGMENLLISFVEENNLAAFYGPVKNKSIVEKLSDAVDSTRFVSSRSGWSIKRLAGRRKQGKASFEVLELSEDETLQTKNCMITKMHASALPFYLGCSLFAISRHAKLLTGKNYFVPVPVDRRMAVGQNSLLSNFISFLYFNAKDTDLESVEKSIGLISRQTISQAKNKLPEKFSSLLDLFRFVPNPFYKTFIDLPSGGNAATFAFSLLSNSKLEGKKIFGRNILDVTHYAPVISPPGLNVIFNEFNGRLKILCSFDEGRITREDVVAYMQTLKQNLLG